MRASLAVAVLNTGPLNVFQFAYSETAPDRKKDRRAILNSYVRLITTQQNVHAYMHIGHTCKVAKMPKARGMGTEN